MLGSEAASTSTSCTCSADALGPTSGEQIGGEQGGIVAALLSDIGDQRARGPIGQLVKAALHRGGGGLGVVPGGGDALVAEEALQVGNVHAEREQPRGHRMAQQMRIDALCDCGGTGHPSDDLADALAGQRMWHRARALLAAGK